VGQVLSPWQPLRGPLRRPRPAAGAAAKAAAAPADAGPPPAALEPGSLQLLVLQPSPFCNLDCDYCYLPDRGDTRRMALPLLDRVLAEVAASGLAGAELSIVWHAGEPTAVPRDWYEAAFALVARHAGGRRVQHHFQTNAVRVDAAWCAFFRRHGVRVGVSLDGPAALHDAHRRHRDGRGSHAAAMRGVAALRAAGLDFHAIAVLTRDALDQADAVYDFFADLGAVQVGFNVEEAEAAHPRSSLDAAGTEAALRRFWQRLLQRLGAEPGPTGPRLRVREVEAVLAALRDPRFGQGGGNTQNLPGRILNVAHDGRWCFWSPELLGDRHPQRGAVVLGRLDTGQLPRVAAAAGTTEAAEQAWQAWPPWQQEIDAGVRRCRADCAYWAFCLGGAPSNKLTEHGRLVAAATRACRLGQQVVVDAVLQALDGQLPPAGAPGADAPAQAGAAAAPAP